ncbi:MAG: hypothetical protein IJW29_09260, partial [Clostridia bacterium]|nr:hypothetical protein [Clostridia bacterium]
EARTNGGSKPPPYGKWGGWGAKFGCLREQAGDRWSPLWGKCEQSAKTLPLTYYLHFLHTAKTPMMYNDGVKS